MPALLHQPFDGYFLWLHYVWPMGKRNDLFAGCTSFALWPIVCSSNSSIGSISQTRPGPSSFWGSREEQRVSVHEKETRQDMFPKPEHCHTQPSKRPGLRMDISAQKETGLMVVAAGHHGLTSSGVTGSGEPCRISTQSPLNMNIIGEWYMLFPWGLACRHAVSSN